MPSDNIKTVIIGNVPNAVIGLNPPTICVLLELPNFWNPQRPTVSLFYLHQDPVFINIARQCNVTWNPIVLIEIERI